MQVIRKREEDECESVKRFKSSSNESILMRFPDDILDTIIKDLRKEDLIRLSLLDKKHRLLMYNEVFKNVQMKWKDIKVFVDGFKHLDITEKVRIICDLQNEKETNNGEWNTSFKDLLSKCKKLTHLDIGLISSARCLKYKDDFDIELSDKIKEITLTSNDIFNAGDVNDKAMFELTQLQRFHNIEKLKLIGFSISRDNYFYPKIKEDFSDFAKRRFDGKLVNLKDITLINCAWEYPLSLKEVFAPEYPIPGISGSSNMNNSNCKPSKLELVYKGPYTKFLNSERFRNFINNKNNEKFMFEVEFYSQLKELRIIVIPDADEKIIQYFPWLEQLDLRREYGLCTDNEVIRGSVIGGLEKIVLIGWKSSSVHDVDRLLEKANSVKYVELGLIGIINVREYEMKAAGYVDDYRVYKVELK